MAADFSSFLLSACLWSFGLWSHLNVHLQCGQVPSVFPTECYSGVAVPALSWQARVLWKHPWATLPAEALGHKAELCAQKLVTTPQTRRCSHLVCFAALLAALFPCWILQKSATLMLNTCISILWPTQGRSELEKGVLEEILSLLWAKAVFHNFGSQLLIRLTRLCASETWAHEVWLQYVLILMIHVF